MKRFLLLLGIAVSTGLASAQQAESEDADESVFREDYYASEIERDAGTPQAVRVGGVVFVAGTSAPGSTFEAQLRGAYGRVQSALAQFGLSMADVAQERIYTVDMKALESLANVRSRIYALGDAPATTWVEVSRLRQEGSLVQIEVIAVAQ